MLKCGNAEQELPRRRFVLCHDGTKLLSMFLPQSLDLNTRHMTFSTRTACARIAVRFAPRGFLCRSAAAVACTAPEPSFLCRLEHGAPESEGREEQEADEEGADEPQAPASEELQQLLVASTLRQSGHALR